MYLLHYLGLIMSQNILELFKMNQGEKLRDSDSGLFSLLATMLY